MYSGLGTAKTTDEVQIRRPSGTIQSERIAASAAQVPVMLWAVAVLTLMHLQFGATGAQEQIAYLDEPEPRLLFLAKEV